MNKIFGLESLTISEIYTRYKNYLIPILIIFVCFILLIQVTIPQISVLSQRQQEVKTENDKLKILEGNYEILAKLSDSTLNSQLTITTDALPLEKNFAGVINAINLSANKAGVFLGDYQFTVGDLKKSIPGKNASSMELTLSVNGGALPTSRFIAELYKSLPVAEVTSVTVNSDKAQITAVFYYQPFPGVQNTAAFSDLTPDKVNLLNELSSWNNPRTFEQVSVSSPSASLSSF